MSVKVCETLLLFFFFFFFLAVVIEPMYFLAGLLKMGLLWQHQHTRPSHLAPSPFLLIQVTGKKRNLEHPLVLVSKLRCYHIYPLHLSHHIYRGKQQYRLVKIHPQVTAFSRRHQASRGD